MSFHVGQTFGNYSITGLLGAGSMGRVFKVENSLTKRTEAMKVLSAELASEIQIKRFEREIRALGKLNHANIAALYNAFHSENQLILLMELIEGQTLESLFVAGRLELETGIEYIQQVLLALGYAHQQGVVHRDVTPANVIVMADGQVKLTDFGLSKSFGDSLLTNCGEILGSLPYLAPEQLKGTTQPDKRSDLYSVGAILYEHLTGAKAFGEKRRLAPVLTDTEEEPRPPSELDSNLPAQWDEILRRALARDPVLRFATAEEFLDAIERVEQPAIAELPLPRLGTLGIGIAAFAGLILALVASPAVRIIRQAPVSIATPWERLHIPAPKFATALTPREPAAARKIERRVVQSAAVTAPAQPVQPMAASVAVNRVATPIRALPITAPIRTQAIAPPARTPAIATPEAEPEISEPAEAETPAPAKKGFWHKMNVFRKRTD